MTMTLSIGGQIYQRWTSVRVSRGLKRLCGAFQIETPGEVDPPILPFAACVLADDGDPLITGYVDETRIEIAARSTRTRIRGRSKTAVLVDCMPQFANSQFNDNALDAIARGVAGAFGINVIVGPGINVGDPFRAATFEWSETAFSFLERLARQRGVLLTDDVNGNLVLATLGTTPAPSPLATGPGGNVFAARGLLSGQHRFSEYTIRSQAGMWQTGGPVQPANTGVANDPGVPLLRPWAGIAESPLMPGDAQKRALWEAAHRQGEAVTAVLSVPEWRAAGQLWQTNQLVKCTVPRLKLNDSMLIGTVEFSEDDQGRRTELTVAPPSAFSPEPLPAEDATWGFITPVVGVAGAGRGGADAG
jgi:prophage tail gpP-like protein